MKGCHDLRSDLSHFMFSWCRNKLSAHSWLPNTVYSEMDRVCTECGKSKHCFVINFLQKIRQILRTGHIAWSRCCSHCSNLYPTLSKCNRDGIQLLLFTKFTAQINVCTVYTVGVFYIMNNYKYEAVTSELP